MKKFSGVLTVQNLVVGLVCVVVIAYGAYLYLESTKKVDEVLLVSPQPFIQAVSLSGKVEAVKDVDLGFAQGGRVGRVNVVVGAQVAQGTVLAETENGDSSALVAQREASLLVAEAELASLSAGTRIEEIAVAEADVRAKKVALQQSVLSLIDEMQDAYTTADNSIKTKVDQFFSNASGATPQLAFAVSNSTTKNVVEVGRREMEVLLLEWEIQNVGISESNISERLLATKSKLTTVSNFLMETNMAISQGLTGGSVTQSVLSGYGTDISTARTSVNTAIAALTSAETAWVNAGAALATSEKTLALRKAGPTIADINAQEARVKSARASVQDAEAQLRKTRIVAPFSGVITAVTVRAGEVAQANTPVISMITASDVLIESYVPEINVALISVNDEADITLDAYGAEAVFKGFVLSIDPAETVRDGASTYRTLLRFSKTDPRIRPGMTANVMIIADSREGVIAVPQKIIVTKDGKKYVTVKVGDTYEERVVTVGAVSSLGTIEILSGLSSGESVVLTQQQ